MERRCPHGSLPCSIAGGSALSDRLKVVSLQVRGPDVARCAAPAVSAPCPCPPAFASGDRQTIGQRVQAATWFATPPTSAESNHPAARPRSAARKGAPLPNPCARHATAFRPNQD